MSCSLTLAAAQEDVIGKAQARQADDPAIATQLKTLRTQQGDQRQKSLDALEGMVRRYDAMRKPIVTENLAEDARLIKANPIYRDPARGQQANWLQDSFERLQRAIENRFRRRNNNNDMQAPNADFSAIGEVLRVFAWIVLAALVGLFIFLVAKHVRWKATLVRKARAVLEEDEPERSLDEWLALADEHEAAGRYREAVRCLFLACLLKFDEANVARFDRGDTNWEHLYRIEQSPNRPSEIDFRGPTRLFDNIWYGHIVRGPQDVAEFRATYVAVRDTLQRRKAA